MYHVKHNSVAAFSFFLAIYLSGKDMHYLVAVPLTKEPVINRQLFGG